MPPNNSQDKKQTQPKMEKIGEHALTNGELVLFNRVYTAFEEIRQLIAMLLCEKYGYPEKEPIAFEFNWQNKTVSAYRPKESKIETTTNEPSAPTKSKTS